MKFLSEIFDFMFAPAGTFDPESSFSATSYSGIFDHVNVVTVNSEISLPVNDGVDVGRGASGMDVYSHGSCHLSD